MAQLLQISAKTAVAGGAQIGDVVGVFEDGHKFTAYEQEVFTITQIAGTKATVEMITDAVKPRVTTVYKSTPTEWTEEEPEQKRVWEKDGDLMELVDEPREKVSYIDGKFISNYDRIEANLATKIIPKTITVETTK